MRAHVKTNKIFSNTCARDNSDQDGTGTEERKEEVTYYWRKERGDGGEGNLFLEKGRRRGERK